MEMNKRTERLVEIMPGFVSWNMILFLVWGGYFFPIFTSYFILAFDVYWVYRGLSMTIAATVSHFRMRATEGTDWMREVRGFGDWKKVRHIVMIMIANEPADVYGRTEEALARPAFPTAKIAVGLRTQ